MMVRLMMFPLGRKQALMAKKMQELQPYLKEIQEKYKDDKEQQTRETLALYKRHEVNPVGGCLPALIQLPIFVGLWQALNNSVALRHASFLWIKNLAAPDMLFQFPFEVPFLGNYFNLLPFLVVALMLVQTKLFSPPATTPEAEMQQKMMKYMMIFMAFMFYKVPSGLGIYFITSSLWSIGERLLLPKITHADAAEGRGARTTDRRQGAGSPRQGGPRRQRPGRAQEAGRRPSAQFMGEDPRRSPQGPDLPQDRRRTRRRQGPQADRRSPTTGQPDRDRGGSRRCPAGRGNESDRPRTGRQRWSLAVPSLDPDDTIAAVASPPGPGLRGLVRLSGPEAWPIALDRIPSRTPTAPPPRRAEVRRGVAPGRGPAAPAAGADRALAGAADLHRAGRRRDPHRRARRRW